MVALLSGIFGGVLRLVPEFVKMWNKKEDNKQELAIMEKTFQLDKQRAELHITEIKEEGKIVIDNAALDALTESIKGQNEALIYTGKPVVDAFISIANILNKLIRPIITIQWVVLLYPTVIFINIYNLAHSGVPWMQAVPLAFGDTEKGICLFIIDFWFIGRVLDAVRKR